MTQAAGRADAAAGESPDRPLRIVFSLLHVGYLRHYAAPIRELARRGHSIDVVLSRGEKDRGDDVLAERLAQESDRITVELAPARGYIDGWRRLAWFTRALLDLARYGDPRFADAPALRRRMEKKIGARVEMSRMDPVSKRAALRMVSRLARTQSEEGAKRHVRALMRLEEAIPASAKITRFLRERAPDVVLASPIVEVASPQVEYIKSAQRLRVPTGVCIASWDNLTNKGLIRVVPDRVIVWNELQRRECAEFHGIPPERVVTTGAQKFDEWFERRPSTTADELKRRAELDPGRPYLLYLCSSSFIAPNEREFVERWAHALRSSGRRDLETIGLLVRPHPQNAAQWLGADLARFGNAAVWPPLGAQPDTEESRAAFYDSLAHAAAAVGVNTSALIEAGIVGKSVLTVLDAAFAETQEGTLHFHYLRYENGGFLHEAASLDEHVEQLTQVLAGSESHAAQTRRFIESFVRPAGLETPAALVVADAIEELARDTPAERARAALPTRALRLALYPIALSTGVVASVFAAAQAVRRRLVTGGRDDVSRPLDDAA